MRSLSMSGDDFFFRLFGRWLVAQVERALAFLVRSISSSPEPITNFIVPLRLHHVLMQVELVPADHSHWNERLVMDGYVQYAMKAVHPQISFLQRRREEHIDPLLCFQFECKLPGQLRCILAVRPPADMRQVLQANDVFVRNLLVLLRHRQLLHLDETLPRRHDEVPLVEGARLEELRFRSSLVEVSSNGVSLVVECT